MNVCKISLVLILAATMSLSCSSAQGEVKFSVFPDRTAKKASELVRTAKLYRDLDTLLIADIMAYTPEIKREFLNEIKTEGRIDADQASEILSEIEKGEKTRIEFLAGIYTGEKKWNDFSESASMWNIRLKASDGTWVSPKEISTINIDDMPDSHLYPFLTPWKTNYKIVFERGGELDSTDGYILRLSSILGEAKFEWKF